MLNRASALHRSRRSSRRPARCGLAQVEEQRAPRPAAPGAHPQEQQGGAVGLADFLLLVSHMDEASAGALGLLALWPPCEKSPAGTRWTACAAARNGTPAFFALRRSEWAREKGSVGSAPRRVGASRPRAHAGGAREPCWCVLVRARSCPQLLAEAPPRERHEWLKGAKLLLGCVDRAGAPAAHDSRGSWRQGAGGAEQTWAGSVARWVRRDVQRERERAARGEREPTPGGVLTCSFGLAPHVRAAAAAGALPPALRRQVDEHLILGLCGRIMANNFGVFASAKPPPAPLPSVATTTSPPATPPPPQPGAAERAVPVSPSPSPAAAAVPSVAAGGSDADAAPASLPLAPPPTLAAPPPEQHAQHAAPQPSSAPPPAGDALASLPLTCSASHPLAAPPAEEAYAEEAPLAGREERLVARQVFIAASLFNHSCE